MDVNKYKSTMNSLNYGNVMAAAARDYQKVRSFVALEYRAPAYKRHSKTVAPV